MRARVYPGPEAGNVRVLTGAAATPANVNDGNEERDVGCSATVREGRWEITLTI
jgi:hypothetical protein